MRMMDLPEDISIDNKTEREIIARSRKKHRSIGQEENGLASQSFFRLILNKLVRLFLLLCF